jgi:hypothetical protein
MLLALQVIGWAVGVPLEVLIIAALLRGHYRRYPFVFLYSLGNFFTTIIDISTYAAYFAGVPGFKQIRVWWYWRNEGVMQVLTYAVVISLIYHATKNLASRRLVRVGLVSGAVLFASISFLRHYGPQLPLSTWMTSWTRDLSFCSTILDLALWAMLIGSREKDKRLLLLSGSLGIQFTSDAIGEAIRSISSSPGVMAGNVLMLIANLVVPYIWWRTFRQPPTKEERYAK